MKIRTFAKLLACIVLTALTLSIAHSSGPPAIVRAETIVSIQPIADQVARIVVASPGGGVNWGNEPLVLTLRTNPLDAVLSATVTPQTLLAASFSGVYTNVLTLTPNNITGIARVTIQAAKDGVTATTTFKVQINKYEDTGQYKWDNMQIPGGGFVDGYVFHPAVANILYARTDVGGAWRFNFTTHQWECITNWVRDDITGSPDQQLGLAIDPNPARAGYVYLAYGTNGTIVRSTDYGETWVRLGNTGGSAAGNVDGRGSGERLIVMPGDGQTMYFAGTTGGLRKSIDGGNTWTGVNLIHNNGVRNATTNEVKLTFVNYDPSNPNYIIAGTAGANGNPVNSAMTRGASVFYSTNGGTTFAELPNQPLPGAQVTTGSRYYGYMGYRSTFSVPDQDGNRYMFITYSDTGSASIGMEGQGVDGALFRYKIDGSGTMLSWDNITPVRVANTYIKNADGLQANRQFGVGIGGVSLDPQHPGTMIVSSHNSDFNSPDPSLESRNMDGIFRSLDYGETWFPVLTGWNMYGNIDPIGDKAPYARPLASGATDNKDGVTPRWEPWTNLHWDTNPTINPFDSNMALYNTGAGAYVTYNLTALDSINAAEPHAVPAAGLNAQQGLFITANSVVTGVVDSRYTPYLIGNATNHLTANQSVKWEATVGLEMTVHLGAGLYSPPSGDVILLDMLGDHGGFAFTSTTTLPQNSFAYPRHIPAEFQYLTGGQEYYPTDSWITGRNASYAALNPDIIVATVSGSWHYNNYGGAVITFDNAKTWYSIPDGWSGGASRPEYAQYGIGNGMPTPTLQTQVNNLKTAANSVSGHVVVNADGSTVIWAITNLNLTSQVYTTDFGQHWSQVQYFNTAGTAVTSGTTYLVPDNVNPNIVYAFGTNTYVSQDGGKTFRQATTTYGSFSTSGLATINGSREIRPDLNNAGIIYIGGNGLWKLTYTAATNAMVATQVPSINTVSRYGPGIGVDAAPNNKTLYVYGTKTGTGQQSGYGIWRSIDGGANWVKISKSTSNPSPAGTLADPYLNANVQYADVRSVVGDSRTFGRVYLSLGNTSGGVVYGDMITNLIETGGKADQTIDFPAIGDKVLTDSPVTITATASSGLAVSFSASGNCTVTGNSVTLTAAGSCTITASQAGDDIYNAAPTVDRTFTIATPTVTPTSTNTPTVTNTPTNTRTSTPTITPLPVFAVNWIDSVNVAVSGNTITKTTNSSLWDAGAASDKQIVSGDGYAQMTINDTSRYIMFGLTHSHTSLSYAELNYAIYTYANTGELAVYENGEYKAGFPGYAAGDIIKIALTNGVVSYARNGSTFYSSAAVPTLPLLVVGDIISGGGVVGNAYIAGSLGAVTPWTPTASPTATRTSVALTPTPIAWIDQARVSASANTIAKTGSIAAWDAGAAADKQLLSGDGYAEMTINDTSRYLMFGLATTHTGNAYTEINYAVYTYANVSELAVYENGVYKTSLSGYSAGDTIRVAVVGGIVKYSKNGSVFYSSTVAPSYPLLAVGDIFTPGGQVNSGMIAGTLGAVTPWTPTPAPTATNTPLALSCNAVTFANLTNVSASGNSISKTSGSSTWTAGATSSQSIASGNGSVEETIANSVSYTMFGLGSGNNNGGYAAINYAIYTYASTGELAVYESGAYRGNFGSYTAGDVIKVSVSGGVVSYAKNGTTFYTSGVGPTYPLLLNAAINTPSGQISNAQICGSNLTPVAGARPDANGGRPNGAKIPALPRTPAAAPTDPAVPSSPSRHEAVPAAPSVPSHSDVPALPVVPARASFLDVPGNFWAAQYINWAVGHVGLSGYDVAGGREFRPNATATRGQVVKLLVSAAGWQLANAGQHFSDVPASSPFYRWIETAAAHNVISGYADGTFRPNATLTRAQMVKIVVLAAGWQQAQADGSAFTDVRTSNWAAAYITTAVAHNLVSGYADGTFRPEAALTRAQMVKLLFNGFAQ